jgi:two-component system NtrC family sensor kinase
MAMPLSYLDANNARSTISKLNANKADPFSRLAAQLAHDLNLPLASILAYTEELVDLAKERYGIKGFNQLVDYLEIIQKEAYHCKEIVEKMLFYAKGLQIQLETVNVHDLLTQCIEDLKPNLKNKDITIKIDFCKNLPNIITDPTGLRQVFMNVLTNADDAIERKGEINIQTRSQEKSILIEISDNGAGIDEAYLEKIFDPYFTTKEEGQGTGLRLAICHGILQTLKGRIAVESKKGKGTTISIWLPKKIKVILA